jgi:cytochrome c oxidase subunit 4
MADNKKRERKDDAKKGAAEEAHGEQLSHLTPPLLLLAVFGALTVLTIATVAVTSIDLGSTGNFVIAMVIATIKAGLVMAFFMHLVWDKPFNSLVFVTSFLLLLLFLGFAVADRKEYQGEIDGLESASAQE